MNEWTLTLCIHCEREGERSKCTTEQFLLSARTASFYGFPAKHEGGEQQLPGFGAYHQDARMAHLQAS